MQLKDIRKGDIVTYRDGMINHVNKPYSYEKWFNNDFNNIQLKNIQIIKIQRYVKCLWFYRLKTIYKRKGFKDA